MLVRFKNDENRTVYINSTRVVSLSDGGDLTYVHIDQAFTDEYGVQHLERIELVAGRIDDVALALGGTEGVPR